MTMFWNHSKQHSSKTLNLTKLMERLFWNHSKQHSSKTGQFGDVWLSAFWNHSKQHSSKTVDSNGDNIADVLEPFETTQL